MDVTNFSIHSQESRHNNPLLPSNIRGLIVGKSNCGKTVLLLNLLLKDGWLDYNNLLVYGNSLHQLEYQIINKGFEKKLGKNQILNIFQNQNLLEKLSPLEGIGHYNGVKVGDISAQFFEASDLIPDPKTLDTKMKNLLTDLPYDEFKKLCDDVWSTKHNFITIDLTSSLLNGKYRKNLNEFYFPENLKV